MGNHKDCPADVNTARTLPFAFRFKLTAKKFPDFLAEIRGIANHAAEARVYVTFSQIHEESYKV